MKIISRDGTSLDVQVDGPENAVPAVFLHGVSSSRTTYDWLPAEVTEGRRIIRLDYRGHGQSDHAPGTYSLQRYFEDTVAVLEQVAKTPAAVIGFSLGGVAGWMIAQQRPDLASAVLLEDPPIYGGEEAVHVASGIAPILRRSIEQEKSWTARSLSDVEAAAELARTPAGEKATFSDVMFPDSIHSLASSSLRRDRGVVESAIDRQMLDGLDTVAPINLPTLILAGGDDLGGVFTTDHERRLAQSHPEAVTIRLARAGHGLQTWMTGRDAYLTLLTGFLERHAPRGRG